MHDGIHHTPFHIRVAQCNDGGCAVAHTEYIGRETADVLQFRSISDGLEVRQKFWRQITARANGRRGSTRLPDDPDPALRLARRPPSRPCNTMAKRHPGLSEDGSAIPADRSSSRPAAPPSTMPDPRLNRPAPRRTTNAAPSTCTTAFTTPCFTSESRSAMTAAAPSPTRNRSGEKRRTSCSSARSPTASRYGRIFGARSPPGPTDAAAAPAFPTIPIRQFAHLAGCSSRHATRWQSAIPG